MIAKSISKTVSTALVFLLLNMVSPVLAQEDNSTGPAAAIDRSATGGAQTLEDVLARQANAKVDSSFRSQNDGSDAVGAVTTNQLGTLGGASDPQLWRALRYGSADITLSTRTPESLEIIQDTGMTWLAFRAGPLREYGGSALLGVTALLVLFYLVRGRIMIDSGLSGQKITRFKAVERFGQWLMAGAFVILGLTGLLQLFGRVALIPLLGHEFYASYATIGKWIHNNFAWPFMIGLVWITVCWIAHNIPNRDDLKWLMVGGGLFTKGVHPPARKFNAGQKLIFWAVVVLGLSISVSGLSLLFPYKLELFASSFAHINSLGLPWLLGVDPLPEQLTHHAEMQLAQVWHTIIAFVFMAIALAHIYIGSVGMQGAFAAMGEGEVDENWAKEHHSIWYTDVTGKPADHHPNE